MFSLFSIVNVIAWIGFATSSIYVLLVLAAGFRFTSQRRQTKYTLNRPAPSISVLKPLHGAQLGLYENLHSHFTQDYQGDIELIFCARQSQDEGLLMARSLADSHREIKCQFLVSGEPQLPNAKAYSLYLMTGAASHGLLVTTDADVRIERDHLTRLVAGFEFSHADLSSCLYRGVAHGSGLFLRLDAIGKTVEMSSGVLVAAMLNGVDFGLGPSMIFTRRAISDVGGFIELGHYWAEDFVFGNRLAADGGRVEISTCVVELVVTAKSPWDSFLNQLRWMQSTRRSRPWGHLGTGLTFAIPFGLLGWFSETVSGHAWAGLFLLGTAIVNRVVLCSAVATSLEDRKVFSSALLYPLRDLLGAILWICSYLPLPTRYHEAALHILPDGRLERPQTYQRSH